MIPIDELHHFSERLVETTNQIVSPNLNIHVELSNPIGELMGFPGRNGPEDFLRVQRSAEGHLGGLQSALRGLAAAGGSGDHGEVATRRAEGWGMLGTGGRDVARIFFK